MGFEPHSIDIVEFQNPEALHAYAEAALDSCEHYGLFSNSFGLSSTGIPGRSISGEVTRMLINSALTTKLGVCDYNIPGLRIVSTVSNSRLAQLSPSRGYVSAEEMEGILQLMRDNHAVTVGEMHLFDFDEPGRPFRRRGIGASVGTNGNVNIFIEVGAEDADTALDMQDKELEYLLDKALSKRANIEPGVDDADGTKDMQDRGLEYLHDEALTARADAGCIADLIDMRRQLKANGLMPRPEFNVQLCGSFRYPESDVEFPYSLHTFTDILRDYGRVYGAFLASLWEVRGEYGRPPQIQLQVPPLLKR